MSSFYLGSLKDILKDLILLLFFFVICENEDVALKQGRGMNREKETFFFFFCRGDLHDNIVVSPYLQFYFPWRQLPTVNHRPKILNGNFQK